MVDLARYVYGRSTKPSWLEADYGPNTWLPAPSGAVTIAAGSTTTSRQTAINANANGTTFVLQTGTHTANGSNYPKINNVFFGEYGAVIDGSGWSSTDVDDAFFKSIDTGVTGVTIQNLEVRNSPQYGINAYNSSSAWVIDHCSIHHNITGISVGANSMVTRNTIHHNLGVAPTPGGGYVFSKADNTRFLGNEIAYNGTEQKVGYAGGAGLNINYYVANNWFHHNVGNGWWIDGNGAGTIIENNLFEDNGGSAIDLEQAQLVIVRSNISRRNLDGVYLTVSRDCQVYSNTLDSNTYGLDLFLDCVSAGYSLPGLSYIMDLTNNIIHDNIVTVPVRNGAGTTYAAIFQILPPATCSAPYIANTKSNNFDRNIYNVVGTSGYWAWPDGAKSWATWQGMPQDVNGIRNVI